MNNSKLRMKVKDTGIKQWQVADLLGIREETLSRRLRHELPAEEQERIIALIDEYMQRGGGEQDV